MACFGLIYKRLHTRPRGYRVCSLNRLLSPFQWSLQRVHSATEPRFNWGFNSLYCSFALASLSRRRSSAAFRPGALKNVHLGPWGAGLWLRELALSQRVPSALVFLAAQWCHQDQSEPVPHGPHSGESAPQLTASLALQVARIFSGTCQSWSQVFFSFLAAGSSPPFAPSLRCLTLQLPELSSGHWKHISWNLWPKRLILSWCF